MRKTFLVILISIFILSCNNKTQYIIENTLENFSFKATISNTDQIIIKAYDSTLTNKMGIAVETHTPTKELKTQTKQQVEDFDKMFVNAEKTDYNCCPRSSYSIHFLNKKEELDFFYVDTLQFKNKVRIYEKGFQYSYLVENQKWKNYLMEIQKK